MARVLLVNPDYYDAIFAKAKVRAAISPSITPLGLLCIAAPVLKDGHEVKLVNLNIAENPHECLLENLNNFHPDVVGITSTTPIIYRAYQIADAVKKVNPITVVVAGGSHPSALPEEVLRESKIDCVVRGEGDFIFRRIVKEGVHPSIPNLVYKKDGEIIKSSVQDCVIKEINELEFPSYELLDIKKYSQPRLSCRNNPVGYLETSRGCYARCIYCNKNIFGLRMRMKSPMKVVDEMEKMLEQGFGEIQIIDDIFTADMKRAYHICEEIIRRGMKFSWYPRGGIRVDRVTPDLLKMMKKAGCYRIPFGIESGSQRIIDVIRKGITLEQAKKAVAWAKDARLETECYFMIGLPTETEDDIKASIDFAVELDPDYAKFAILIPLPGTPLFDSMWSNGQIKTRDWEKYNFATSSKELYEHDCLSSEIMDRYYTISHRRFYFRPRYMRKMLRKTIMNGTLFDHIIGLLKTRW